MAIEGEVFRRCAENDPHRMNGYVENYVESLEGLVRKLNNEFEAR